jgi:high-affinity nickel permease
MWTYNFLEKYDYCDVTIFTDIEFNNNKVVRKDLNSCIIKLVDKKYHVYALPYFLDVKFENANEFILFTIHLIQRQNSCPKYIEKTMIRYMLDFVTDSHLKEMFILKLL